MNPEVSKEEWKLANKFFSQFKSNSGPVKFSRKLDKDSDSSDFLNAHGLKEIDHSFVKTGDTITAVQPGKEYLGEGGNAIVKLGQNEAGENCAVKIEVPYDNSHLIFDEQGILRDLGNLLGQATRKIDSTRKLIVNHDNGKSVPFFGCVLFKNKLVHSIKYTVQKIIPGQDLNIALEKSIEDNCFLSYSKRLFYAYMACYRLSELHNLNIIHCDIKSKNIKVTDNDLHLIDYGYALRLDDPQETKHFPNVIVGSPEYMAPEIAELKLDVYGDLELDDEGNPIFLKEHGYYSVHSDIYALGKLIENDLQLYIISDNVGADDFSDSILMKMQSKNPKDRPSLYEVQQYLLEKLKQQSDYSAYSSMCDKSTIVKNKTRTCLTL